MKILFVLNSLVGGGAEKVFVDMLKYLNDPTYEIDILLVDEWGVYCDEVKKMIPYQRIIRHVGSPRLIRYFYGAISILKMKILKYASPAWLHRKYVKKSYDIEVAYIEGIATKIVAGCKDQAVMKYAWVHTDIEANPWATVQYRNQREEYECYRQIDKVVAVSRKARQAVERRFGVSAQVIYNVLDSEEIRRKAVSLTRELKKGAGLAFVSIGTLWQAKGYLRLLKVIHQLVKEGFDPELHLIGEGEERQQLEDCIRNLGLQSRVTLYGFQPEPYDLLRQADAYVCSSYVEGFSTTVTEALILGVPVVTTDCAGMEELLGASESGLIVENSEAGLYEGMKRFLQDETLRQEYQTKAVIRGREFSIKARIDELNNMFRQDTKVRIKEDAYEK